MLPARQARRYVRLEDQPRVLLLTRQDRDEAVRLRREYAAKLVKLGLSREMGVYVAPYCGWHGVWLGRHDGGEITVSPAVARAAMRAGIRLRRAA
jgi:hypothetical protein